MTDREYVESVWEESRLYHGARKMELKLKWPIRFEGSTKEGELPLYAAAAVGPASDDCAGLEDQ
jgi:hypothetical protein